jgi:hypothetical protein
MVIAAKNGSRRATAIGGDSPTNGGESAIAVGIPYVASVTIRGVADILFHRWNCEAVAEKAAAAKGSKAKKTDDIESYVYRDEANGLCLPGEYLRGSIVAAAKFRQDPRSPRKSAMDLFKAAVVSLTPLAPLGKEAWDYEHSCRVVIQRSAVTRVRPAMKAGWEASFDLQINLPEYVSPELLIGVLNDAGRLVGVGDFRPTYGRFQVTKFEVG